MKKKKKNQNNLQLFYTEVKKSIILREDQKEYWLKNGDRLPPSALQCITREISRANRDVEKSLRAAVENDPKNIHLNKLKTEVNKMKVKVLKLEEASQSQNPEDFLSSNLQI